MSKAMVIDNSFFNPVRRCEPARSTRGQEHKSGIGFPEILFFDGPPLSIHAVLVGAALLAAIHVLATIVATGSSLGGDRALALGFLLNNLGILGKIAVVDWLIVELTVVLD